MKIMYKCINTLFHILHFILIGFVMIGWLFPLLRTAHLIVVFLTLGSWFILGHWYGTGYCPITDWHWKIKDALGEGRPQGSYIHSVLEAIMRKKLDSASVDYVVLVGTISIAVLSLIMALSSSR
jgi:hypothetical protein